MIDVRIYSRLDEPRVIDLWDRCGLTRPWNDPRRDIARKLTVQPELFLVGSADGVVVASVMAGYDGHRGWMYYLAVDPDWQGRGAGRIMVEEAEARLRELGCAKVNLQIRRDNVSVAAFFRELGYREDEVVSFGKRLIVDGQEQEPCES